MKWHLILMAVLYIAAGLNHFFRPKFYQLIIPPTLKSNDLFWVYLSGFFEVLLGALLLYQPTRNYGVIGIILMLIVFFWVHFYMLSPSFETKIPQWILWLRIPLQFVLIYWAWIYYK